jgi:hypothetical protein
VKHVLAIFLLGALASACSASLKGPDTTGAADRCGGHLDCGAAGCCNAANGDGAGYSCNAPGSQFGACSVVGLSNDGNGMFSARRQDAGR